jgi:hypothetical protein
MIYEPSIIERLQLDMGAIAQCSPYFTNVSVNIVRPRVDNTAVMIQNRIQKALEGLLARNGKTGAVLVFDMPLAEFPEPNAPGPDITVICKVRAIENPLINMGVNGTLQSAEELGLRTLNLFQLRYWQDMGSGLTPLGWRPLPEYIERKMVAIEASFKMRFVVGGLPKTPMPGISGPASDVVIIGPAGSTVYYTTDGSYPVNDGSGTAQTLEQAITDGQGNPVTDGQGNPILSGNGSIAVPSPTLVRAVAYINNQLASDLAAKTVS